jgi:tryptophan-rich sensory protein
LAAGTSTAISVFWQENKLKKIEHKSILFFIFINLGYKYNKIIFEIKNPLNNNIEIKEEI